MDQFRKQSALVNSKKMIQYKQRAFHYLDKWDKRVVSDVKHRRAQALLQRGLVSQLVS
jgi:hypothetical protein